MSQAPRISLSNPLQTKSFLLSLSRKFFIFNIDLFFLLWGIFLNISFYLSSLSLYSSIHYLYYGITFPFFAFFSFLSLFDLLVMKPESCIFHVISTVMLFAVILMQNEPWHLQLFRWIMLSELSSLYPETVKRNPLSFSCAILFNALWFPERTLDVRFAGYIHHQLYSKCSHSSLKYVLHV